MEYTSGYSFEVKELDAMGEFEGMCAVFNHVDRQNDVIVKGAFAHTIKESGGKVPVLMGHNTGRIIGFGTDAKEDATGLRVWGQFTLDADEGRNAYALSRHSQKLGVPIRMSIGYMIPPGGATHDGKSQTRTLRQIELLEYSLVACPAQPLAGLTRVKDALEGRELAMFLVEEGGFPLDDANFIANHGFAQYKARQAAGGGFATVIDAARKLYKN